VKKNSKRVIERIPITEARRNLGSLARRIRTGKGYAILEKDGIPVLGLMDADELEDYLELRDAKVQRAIRASNDDIDAGRIRPVGEVLSHLRSAPKPSGRRRWYRPCRRFLLSQHRTSSETQGSLQDATRNFRTNSSASPRSCPTTPITVAE